MELALTSVVKANGLNRCKQIHILGGGGIPLVCFVDAALYSSFILGFPSRQAGKQASKPSEPAVSRQVGRKAGRKVGKQASNGKP